MTDRYNDIPNDDWFCETLDELMCEYVDSTMDPDVRVIFEEFLTANPEIAAKAGCLKKTRSLLCQYGCHVEAPKGLHTRLRSRLAWEMLQNQSKPFMGEAAEKVAPFVTMTSAVVVVVFVGLLASTFFLDGQSHSATASPATTTPPISRLETSASDLPARVLLSSPEFPSLDNYPVSSDTFLQVQPVPLLVESTP